MKKKTILMWFRQDLRTKDNPALHYAATEGDVLPIYIFDDKHPQNWQMGEASQWWLHHSLKNLGASLSKNVLFFRGDPLKIIPQLSQQLDISTVVWNRCYEPWQIARDIKLKKHLSTHNLEALSFNGSLLWEPWQVLKKDNTPYKVFTPYYRNGCLKKPSPRLPENAPSKIAYAKHSISSLSLDDLGLIPPIAWYAHFDTRWTPGEAGAADHLSQFLKASVGRYKEDRNVPNIRGTSYLSPHLHFGEISPNQIWYAALHAMASDMDNDDLQCFLSELGWREFSYYLLYHFPSLPEKNFQNKFDQFSWRKNTKSLKAWQNGQTGIPIVDAGMRELWQTGYMHNRVRMIVGSFLVKNLLVHWRHGAAWFWDCLLDADLASNSASWQWIAGSGADAAPYFRIFNPVTQGERFDPEGHYVKQYCPELHAMPKKYIHKPWEADDSALKSAGVKLGRNYPHPIVGLKESRQQALDAFAELKLLIA